MHTIVWLIIETKYAGALVVTYRVFMQPPYGPFVPKFSLRRISARSTWTTFHLTQNCGHGLRLYSDPRTQS